MIFEAWARRLYRAVLIDKVDEALGEANETRSWLDDALDCGYLGAEQFQKMEGDWLSIFLVVTYVFTHTYPVLYLITILC